MSRARVLLPLALLAQPALAQEWTPPVAERTPMVGREGPESDACGGVGRVARIIPTSDAMLPVFGGPSDTLRPKDRIGPDTFVWLCDAEGEWQGIVYAGQQFQDLGDCRVSSPVDVPQAYSGPCRSGWVPARFLHLVAD